MPRWTIPQHLGPTDKAFLYRDMRTSLAQIHFGECAQGESFGEQAPLTDESEFQ